MENITVRNKLVRSKSDLDFSINMTKDALNSSILDATMLSTYSDIQNNISLDKEYIQEIDNLKGMHSQMEQEIDNLNLENNGLKKTIQAQETQIAILKKITQEIGTGRTSMTPLRRKITHIHRHISKTSPLHMNRTIVFNTPPKLNTEKTDVEELQHSQLTGPYSQDMAHIITTDDNSITREREDIIYSQNTSCQHLNLDESEDMKKSKVT
jgi:hypothetical protein